MNTKEHVQRYKSLKSARSNWENYWQELADVLLPKRADIVAGTVRGEDRNSVIYDSAPMRARRGLANAIDGLIKPKTSQWFHMAAVDDSLNDIDAVKTWIEEVEEIMWNEIYTKNARFIQRSGEVDNDLVALGTGILFIAENRLLNGLLFKAIHPRDAVILENADGIVDTLYFCQKMTARQAFDEFGNNVGEKILEELRRDSDKDSKRFDILFCVYPNKDRVYDSVSNDNLPFALRIIDKDHEHEIEKSGFHEFPFAVPRWETASGEVYGRSPGMVALPDARTLQAMGKTILVAGQKAVDPPLVVFDDAMIGAVRTFPGGISVVDGEAARGSRQRPVDPLFTGAQIPLGLEMQNATRQAVEAAFFKNVFSLPIDGPQMTATEVLERKEEFIREIGPVFGRLESDYIGHVAERVFGILLRQGKFPEPPEEILERELKFEFQSPIQRARKQIEAVSTSQAFETFRPFIEHDPTIMDNFDGDKIMRDMPDTFGVPRDWLRPINQVDQIRKGRQAAQEQQQQLNIAQQQAEIASTANAA